MSNEAAPKERPILFQGAMVRALLAGTKTQTRRVVKPQPYEDPAIKVRMRSPGVALFGVLADAAVGDEWTCPYGQPGDRLWVREGLYLHQHAGARGGWLYRADDKQVELAANDERVPWMISWAHHQERDYCPSIHMPRWACRILLEITAVRVERLQAISEADAAAEGVEVLEQNGEWRNYLNPIEFCVTGRASYSTLWESINGPGSWDANPWVWVVEFRRIV